MSKSKQWYLEPINWTLSGKGFSEKNIQQVFIHLLGKQQLFDPKEIRHQVIEPAPPTSKSSKSSKTSNSSKSSPTKKAKQPKPKKMSRKEQIIEANTLRILMEKEKSDLTKIHHHIQKKCFTLPKLETGLGRLMWMGNLLKYYFQQSDLVETYDVYLDLQWMLENIKKDTTNTTNTDTLNTRYLTTFKSEYRDTLSLVKDWIKEQIPSSKSAIYQLTQMHDRMPPLTRFKKKFRLDEWQQRALCAVEDRRSLLICAPTSSGKTVITTYLSLVSGPKIFVVPSESLVWQVASIFSPLLHGKIALLSENIQYLPDHEVELFIGTPRVMETFLVKENLAPDITYGIFDEIHDLNGPEGDCTERILKLLDCPVLALSATIGNPQELTEWWRQFRPDLRCITHQSRFLNLQRYSFNILTNNIDPVSPVKMLTLSQIQDPDFIKSSLELTPPDLYRLWLDMKKHFPESEIQPLHPKRFEPFQNSYRITLPQCNLYEKMLQEKLHGLSLKYPGEMEQMCFADTDDSTETSTAAEPTETSTAAASTSTSTSTGEDESSYHLATRLQQRDLLPSLWFQQHSIECDRHYQHLVNLLEKKENEAYPDYQRQLEQRWEEYRANEKKLADMESLERQHGDDYSPSETAQFRLPQPPPLGQPHPKFVCFPKAKSLKPSDLEGLITKLAREMHLKQPERHPFIRGLRRGIGLYLYHLPLAYLQMVQRLAQEGVLGVVFSDISLAYGVNMPFRTVVFCHDHPQLDALVAKQMAGRAGRRGMDTQGNLLYYQIPWKKICQLSWGSLVRVTGRNIYHPLLALGEATSPETLDRVCQYPLLHHTSVDHQSSLPVAIGEYPDYSRSLISSLGLTTDPVHPFIDLIWHLRNYPAEAVTLWKMTNLIRRYFARRRDERDDVRLFLLLSYLVERKPSSTTTCLPDLDEIHPGLSTEFRDIQETLPEELRLAYLDQPLDASLYQIFQNNRIPPEYTPDQIDLAIKRLRNIGEVCRIYRNRMILKTEYLSLEEIFRKTFRRIYYVILAC